MSIDANPDEGKVFAGLPHGGLWLGIAAVLMCLLLLFAARCFGRCCCCLHAGPSVSQLDVTLGDELKKDDFTDKKCNINDRGDSETTIAPRGSNSSSDAVLKTGPQDISRTRFSTLQNVHLASESLPLLLLHSAAYGANDRRNCPTHPYNVSTVSEASVPPPSPHTQPSPAFSPSFPMDSAVSAASVGNATPPPLPLPADLTFADEFEEQHTKPTTEKQRKQSTSTSVEDNTEDGNCSVPYTPSSRTSSTAPDKFLNTSSGVCPRGRLRALSPNRVHTHRVSARAPSGERSPRLQSTSIGCRQRWSKVAATPPTASLPAFREGGSSQRSGAARSGGCNTTELCSSSSSTSISPTLFKDDKVIRQDGGEYANVNVSSTQERLQADIEMHRAELVRVQEELRTALLATEQAEAQRRRIRDEVADMERYKGTVDGIVAFTLRELEDAAGGVEEAEAQMKREAAVALQKVLAAQEMLCQRSMGL